MKRASTTSQVVLPAAVGAHGLYAEASHDERAIRAIDATWSAALERKDLDGVMAVYADDALFLPPGAPLIEGKAGIRERFARRLALPAFAASFSPTRIVVAQAGDLAGEHGTSRSTVEGAQGPVTRTGKHLVTWRKRDGTWQVTAESLNYDTE